MVRFAAIVLMVAAVGQTAFADPVLDQSYMPDPTDTNAGVGVTQADVDWGQTFTVGLTGLLTEVQVQVQRQSAVTADLVVDVRTTTGGVPDGDAGVLVSVSIAAASVSTLITPPFLSVPVSSAGIMVTTGDVLAIVLSSTDTNGTYLWKGTSTSGYAGGEAFVRLDGGSWINSSAIEDNAFKTFVDSMRTDDQQRIPEPSLLLLAMTGAGLLVWRRRGRAD